MTELKTLKDFEFPWTHDKDVKEELKAEAVKWVKQSKKIYDEKFENGEYEICYLAKANEKWIKHFFDLTEDDLK